jgi:hypothetical protein
MRDDEGRLWVLFVEVPGDIERVRHDEVCVEVMYDGQGVLRLSLVGQASMLCPNLLAKHRWESIEASFSDKAS